MTDLGSLPVLDSGTRSTFTTGAVRDGATGKGRYDLLPCHAIKRVAQVFEKGAAKYAERNWEKGIPTHRFADSAKRHLDSYLAGARDEDHLAQAAWNVLCLIETLYWIGTGHLPPELDTLPGPRTQHHPLPAEYDQALAEWKSRVYDGWEFASRCPSIPGTCACEPYITLNRLKPDIHPIPSNRYKANNSENRETD